MIRAGFQRRNQAVANRYDLDVIIVCQEGYTSSLVAVALLDLGLSSATDVVGGVRVWKEAGLRWIGGDVDEMEG